MIFWSHLPYLLPLQEVVGCFTDVSSKACRHCCGALQTWPSVLIGGQECGQQCHVLEEFGEKKRDVFWILKIYVEYKIKRRFNKNGCVVFHCVFVGHVFFFEMWEWLFFLCQVQKRSRFRHQELLALEVSLDIPVIGLNSGCATSRPGQSSQALSFNRMKGANVRRSSSGTC